MAFNSVKKIFFPSIGALARLKYNNVGLFIGSKVIETRKDLKQACISYNMNFPQMARTVTILGENKIIRNANLANEFLNIRSVNRIFGGFKNPGQILRDQTILDKLSKMGVDQLNAKRKRRMVEVMEILNNDLGDTYFIDIHLAPILQEMPLYYFITNSSRSIADQMKALALNKFNEYIQTNDHTWAKVKDRIIYLSDSKEPGDLLTVLEGLKGIPLKSVEIHQASKRNLTFYVFDLIEVPADMNDPIVKRNFNEISKLADEHALKIGGYSVTSDNVKEFFRVISHSLAQSPAPRLLRYIEMYFKAKGKEAILFAPDNDAYPECTRFTIASSQIPYTGYFLRIAKILALHGIEVHRSYMENMENDCTRKAIKALNIKDFDPIRALVEKLWQGTPEAQEMSAQAIREWGDLALVEPLINNLRKGVLGPDERDAMAASLIQLGWQVENSVGIITLYVTKDGKKITSPELLQKIKSDLKTIKWAPETRMDELITKWSISLNEANFLKSAAEFIHDILSKKDPELYSEDLIADTIMGNEDAGKSLINYFEFKFDPKNPLLGRPKYKDIEAMIRSGIEEKILKIEDDPLREIFQQALGFIDHMIKTNCFKEEKSSLAYELDGSILKEIGNYSIEPYELFFTQTRFARGIHTSFSPIARGGVRIFRTTPENYLAESDRHLDEAYFLAGGPNSGQHLKNKGRGGCKDRILLQPGADPFQAFMGHVNGMLDLILTKETVTDLESIGRELIVHGTKEPTTLLFLGPDEGTASYMDLLALRARDRGYKYWPTISTGKSKEYGGISHDEIGATSEGVITFMEESLRSINMDPQKNKFTIVQTGDTEGDLGRNNIRILFRKYKDNAIYKAIVGGKGCIIDPKGLDIEELNRLAEGKLPITKFDPEKLSEEGSIVDVGTGSLCRKVGGKIKIENVGNEKVRQIWAGLVATEKADVLLPCGGRQNTITGKGDKSYPYSIPVDSIIGHFKVISEGANVFFGENARLGLDKNGTVFIKDITANQNGVNFSFTEVAALLTLSVEEFLTIRDKYIVQANDVNVNNNRLEFRMINEIKAKEGTPRPTVSADINREINRIADIIRSADWINEGYSLEFLFNSLPPILIDNYKDRILKQWPASYRRAMTAAAIAQRLVFDKGINFVGREAKEKKKTELEVIKEYAVK